MNSTLQNETDLIEGQNILSIRRPFVLTIAVNLIGLLAILGNGLVLIILGKSPSLLESTRKFCMHLAVTDFGNGILSFVIIYSTMASSRNQVDLCIWILLLVKFFVFASQAIVTVNTFERYVGICKRQAYPKIMKKSTVYILLCLAWVYAFVLILVSVIGFSPEIHQSFCYYHLMFRNWVYFVEASIMFTLATVNFVLFGFIISKAWTFYNKVTPASFQGTSKTAVRNVEMKRSIRNGKMMGIVTAAFLVCWMPYNVYQFYVGSGAAVSDNLVSAANTMYLIGMCNSTINPFIYVWQKKEFRDRCKIIFRCKQSQQSRMADPSSPNNREFAGSAHTKTTKLTLSCETSQHKPSQQKGMIASSSNVEDITTIEID